MEAVAHAPQELLGGGHLVRLARDDRADADELPPDAEPRVGLGLTADAVAGTGRPADAVDVAQRAGAALHVGLEEVERPAEAGVPRGGLGLEALDEAAEVLGGEEAVVGAGDEVADEGVVAREEAEIEEGGGGGEVFLGEGDGVGGAEDLVADGEADVPQRVEEGLGEGVGGLGAEGAGRDDEDDVGVAPEGDGATPEAADGGERDSVGG